MIQLILHLWGDYIFQPEKWAMNKRKSIRYAAYHGITYGLLFLLAGYLLPNFSCSLYAFLVITITHILIDRTYPARHLIFAKNWLGGLRVKWGAAKKTGYPNTTPDWLAVWLMIIVDNTLHLTINYAALALL